MSDAAPTYRFAPAHELGLFGLARCQVVSIGLAVVLALAAVLAARQPLVGLATIVIGAAATFAPLRGRPLVSWLAPLAVGLGAKRQSEAPITRHDLGLGKGVSPSGGRARRQGPLPIRWQLPGLPRLVLRSEKTPLGEVGVADVSGSGRSAAVTFALFGPRFGLVDAIDQARALACWGQALGALAGDAEGLHRLQLTERIAPDDLAAPWGFVAAPARGNADALALYREGLEALAGQAVHHEVLLTMALGHAGGKAGRERIATECDRIARIFASAGFTARPLSQASLACAIAGALDPERSFVLGALGAVEPRALAPRAWHAGWSSVTTDSGHHACFEASGFPRLPVGPEWAWPLVLAEAPITRRALALHIELANPDLAIRRAERAVVSHESDEAIRARWGFRSGAREQQAHEAALDRELELASGYADCRFSLLASVTAMSEHELASSARALVSQAAASHVELRRCYHRQAEALVATLPLGVVRFRGGWK